MKYLCLDFRFMIYFGNFTKYNPLKYINYEKTNR